MDLLTVGSSPSQMIATRSGCVAAWRSRQETEAFSVPSSNQRIETLPWKLVFLMRWGGFIQAMRADSLRQKLSGSRAAWSYMARYFSAETRAWAAISGFTGMI